MNFNSDDLKRLEALISAASPAPVEWGTVTGKTDGESFSITVTEDTYRLLESLCECGYGCSVSDAASGIVSAEVRRLIVSGELDRLRANRPVKRSPPTKEDG